VKETINKTRLLFIVNPISGTKKKTNFEELVAEHLDTNIFEYQVVFTECAGHATQLARQAVADNISMVVAVGGDGTVNEVASALCDTQTALGVIPMGSGNGLGRQLNLPLNPVKAIKLLNCACIASIDYGIANNIKFFCTCGVGFDAAVSKKFAESEKRGLLTYVHTTISAYMHYRAKKYKLRLDGAKLVRRAFLITFANAAQYGNNAYIAPSADLQDGMLDISVLRPFPVISALRLAARLFNKQIEKSSYVEIYRAKEIVLKRKKKGPFHFDGEPIEMPKKIKITVVEKGLRVLVDPKSGLTCK